MAEAGAETAFVSVANTTEVMVMARPPDEDTNTEVDSTLTGVGVGVGGGAALLVRVDDVLLLVTVEEVLLDVGVDVLDSEVEVAEVGFSFSEVVADVVTAALVAALVASDVAEELAAAALVAVPFVVVVSSPKPKKSPMPRSCMRRATLLCGRTW